MSENDELVPFTVHIVFRDNKRVPMDFRITRKLNKLFRLVETIERLEVEFPYNADFSKVKAEYNNMLQEILPMDEIETSSKLSLDQCLEHFTHPEIVEASKCMLCLQAQQKKLGFQALPPFLVVHLNRFKEGRKLQNKVNFPKDKLEIVTQEGVKVDFGLYGIIYHQGSLEEGHYVAVCRDEESNTWHRY